MQIASTLGGEIQTILRSPHHNPWRNGASHRGEESPGSWWEAEGQVAGLNAHCLLMLMRQLIVTYGYIWLLYLDEIWKVRRKYMIRISLYIFICLYIHIYIRNRSTILLHQELQQSAKGGRSFSPASGSFQGTTRKVLHSGHREEFGSRNAPWFWNGGRTNDSGWAES